MLDRVGGFDVFAPLVLGSLVECYGGTTVNAVVELCFQACGLVYIVTNTGLS